MPWKKRRQLRTLQETNRSDRYAILNQLPLAMDAFLDSSSPGIYSGIFKVAGGLLKNVKAISTVKNVYACYAELYKKRAIMGKFVYVTESICHGIEEGVGGGSTSRFRECIALASYCFHNTIGFFIAAEKFFTAGLPLVSLLQFFAEVMHFQLELLPFKAHQQTAKGFPGNLTTIDEQKRHMTITRLVPFN